MLSKKDLEISDLLTVAQMARDNASAAFSCLSNNLFLDPDPNWMEYRGNYNHHATMSGIAIDYLRQLEGTLAEMVRIVEGKEGAA